MAYSIDRVEEKAELLAKQCICDSVTPEEAVRFLRAAWQSVLDEEKRLAEHSFERIVS